MDFIHGMNDSTSPPARRIQRRAVTMSRRKTGASPRAGARYPPDRSSSPMPGARRAWFSGYVPTLY